MPGWSVAVPFMPVPGPLQTVQRAEFRGGFFALQAFWPGHVGNDNPNAVRSIGRLLDLGVFSTPLPLLKDGDLIVIVQHMIQAWGADTVGVTKVKGHATEDDVDQGRVRMEERLGNAEADTVAILGRPISLNQLWMPGGFSATGQGSLVPHHSAAPSVHDCGFPGFGKS